MAACLMVGLALLVAGGCVTVRTQQVSGPGQSQGTLATYGQEAATVQLFDAIEARLATMQAVAAAKWMSGAPIRDAAREQAVLDEVAARSTAFGLDPSTTRALFDLQIRWGRVVQQRFHEEWRSTGRCAPCDPPQDLSSLRATLDGLTAEQLRSLRVTLPSEADAPTQKLLRDRAAALAERYGLSSMDADELRTTLNSVRRNSGLDALSQVRSSGVLLIGTTGDYAPFSFETEGRLTGADLALGRSLARSLHVQPVFVRTSWPTLLEDLRRRRFDVALSGISRTPERAAAGLFSGPYHAGGKTIVARCAERTRFDTARELDRPDVRIVVNPGGTNERYVREHVRAARIVVHPDNRTVFDEIVAGRADAMVTDDIEAELQAQKHAGVLCRTLPGLLSPGDKRVLTVRDPALQHAVDRWLAGILEQGVPERELAAAVAAYVQATRAASD